MGRPTRNLLTHTFEAPMAVKLAALASASFSKRENMKKPTLENHGNLRVGYPPPPNAT